MVSKKRLFLLAVLLLILSLALVACVRPVPGSDTSQETTTETDETTITDTTAGSGETADSATGTESGEETTAGSEESTEGTTPRIDETAVTPEAEGEDKTTEAETTEAPSSTGDKTVETTEEGTKETEMSATEETSEETSAETTTEATPSTHTVAAGENLYRIGLKYNVSWVTLAEFNNLDNANRIKVGQVLNIPSASAETPNNTEPEPTPSPLTETTYTVKAGDNLYRIGLAYGINWTQIAEANGLVNPNQILVGQVLKIPVDTPGPTPQFTHMVKSGETLLSISLQYGISWPAIAEANDISSPYVIFPGQSLIIPGG